MKIFGIGAAILIIIGTIGSQMAIKIDQSVLSKSSLETKDDVDIHADLDLSDCPCRGMKNAVGREPTLLEDGIYPIGNCPEGIYDAIFIEPDMITFETDANGGGRDEWVVTFYVPQGGYPLEFPLTSNTIIELNGEFISSYSTEVYEDHATVTLITLEDSFTGTFYGDENPWDNPELFALYLTVESYYHSVQDALDCVLSQFIPEIFISGDDVHIIGQPRGGKGARRRSSS